MNIEEHKYSVLEASASAMFSIAVEEMSENEIDEFLTKPNCKAIEAIHLACNRRLSFPFSYLITEEMQFILWKLREAVKNKELKYKLGFASGIEKFEKPIRFSDNASGAKLSLSICAWGEEIISLTAFLEWMINTGIPLPEAIHRKIGVPSLIDTTFESYWKQKRIDPLVKDKAIHPVSKPRRERLQQRTAVQCFLFEKRAKTTLDEIEKSCEKLGYIPNGEYEGNNTFEENVRVVLSKPIRCVGPKRFQEIELKALNGIFSEKPKLCLDLRELKIVCQCIATVLPKIHSGISKEAIFCHPLTQQYLVDCHPVVWNMHRNWIDQVHNQLISKKM